MKNSVRLLVPNSFPSQGGFDDHLTPKKAKTGPMSVTGFFKSLKYLWRNFYHVLRSSRNGMLIEYEVNLLDVALFGQNLV